MQERQYSKIKVEVKKGMAVSNDRSVINAVARMARKQKSPGLCSHETASRLEHERKNGYSETSKLYANAVREVLGKNGPRGGKTLIDLFGLEIIMKKNRRFTRCIIEKLLMSYCYTTGRVVVNDLDTSDSGLKAIANKSKMRSCIRLTNRKKLENITTDFDYSDIERVMGHAIY